MKTPPTAILAALAAAGLLSCSLFKDDPPEEPDPDAPRLVGRISSVAPDGSFVLIESYGSWSVPAGAILSTRGPENRGANLLATGETLRRHAAADIQSGTVEIGDGVYTTAKEKPKPEAEDEAGKKDRKPETTAPDESAAKPAETTDSAPDPEPDT